MKIAVLSGKGGTGKTFISVNLAAVADNSVYIDCDVEEPNGRLFLKPEQTTQKEVMILLPQFDEQKCIGCRNCVKFCNFNALAFLKNKPKVFKEICHSCGGCALVCKSGAVREVTEPIGYIETGTHKNIRIITGELNIGEASGIPVIKQALQTGFSCNAKTTIIDCPPGSACSVTESITEADYCLIVAEPTIFGLHNFKMATNLVKIMSKPCGVIINKYNCDFPLLEDFCTKNALPVIAKIPYSNHLSKIVSQGKIAAEECNDMHTLFLNLLNKIGGAL